MKIFTRVEGWDGEIFSVPFKNGIGETDDVRLIERFRSLGWRVEDVSQPEKETVNRKKGRKKKDD